MLCLAFSAPAWVVTLVGAFIQDTRIGEQLIERCTDVTAGELVEQLLALRRHDASIARPFWRIQ